MIRCNTRRACPTVLETENILSESGWSLRAEHLLGALLGDSVREGEAQALLGELADVRSLDILGLLELDDAEDVDRPEAGTVAGSHVGVERVNGICSGQLTVLLVHVVRAGTRVVSDPDAKVLDLEGVLLVDHLDADDLTGGLLDLLETTQEVPVSGLGDRLVGSEDGHAVEGGGRVSLGGQVAPDDLVFLKTT